MLDAWLTLYYTPNIGARRFKQLIDYFGSPEKALKADGIEWQNAGMPKSVTLQTSSQIEEKVTKALQWSKIPGNHILYFEHEAYPPLLKEIYAPPMILFVQGSLEILGSPQIAVVGARKPTKEGFYNADLFTTELANAGLTITSGLALGIDYTAHNAAVKQQKPTIAVLGTGLNEIYPKSHIPLSEAILEIGGAIVSEYPLHMPAKPQNFPRRNRIIAGLSLGTLVIEAALRSGSLITARMSMEENREVFAIPGSIHDPQSRGCHKLIREGATLVESTYDIRSSLNGWFEEGLTDPQENLFSDQALNAMDLKFKQDRQKSAKEKSQDPLSGELFEKKSAKKTTQTPKLKAVILPEDHPQKALYDLLKAPHSINQLVEILKIPAPEITTDLMMLEIEGVITADQGFYRQKLQ